MSLTIPSFDDLRDSNEKALQRAGHSWDAESIPKEKIDRLTTLLDERAEIEDLASTQSQREEYGIDRWHRDFVRLRDIADAEQRERLWGAIPDCKFRRFQESFSHPHQFIVPAFVEDAAGIHFPHIDFHSLSVHGCLVSADLISGALSESLELADDTDTEGQPIERLRRRQLDAALKLKKIWDETTPLQRANRRILVVGESPSDGLDFEYAGVTRTPSALEGSVILTRERQSGDRNIFRSRIVQVFDSSFAADRKTGHEDDNYSQEMSLLVGLESQFISFNRRLNQEWRDASDRDALRSEAQALLSDGAVALATCENKFKVEAQQLLEAASSLKDRRGRENITVVMTRMVAVIQRLQSRQTEMIGKGTYNQADAMAIERANERDRSTIMTFRKSVLQAPAKLEVFDQLFSDRPLSPTAHDAAVQGLLRMMRLDMPALSNVLLKPNRQYAQLMLAQDVHLQRALHERNRDMADDALVRMHIIGKFQEIELRFQHILQEIMNPRVAIEHLIQEVAELRQQFTEYQLLPQHIVQEYVAPVAEMNVVLGRIEGGLKRYASQKLDTAERAVMYGRLGAYLKTVNVLTFAGSAA